MLSKALQIQEPELPDIVKEKQEESLNNTLEMETSITMRARRFQPWQQIEDSCPIWALPLQTRLSDPGPEDVNEES